MSVCRQGLGRSCTGTRHILTAKFFLSDTDVAQNNQDDSTDEMVIILAVSGVALVAIFITVIIVVLLLHNRSHSPEKTMIIVPGTPTSAHTWKDVDQRTDT